MSCNVDAAPVLRRNLGESIGMKTNDIRLAQEEARSLIQWEPGDLIDQLLLRLVICSSTSSGVSHDVGSIHGLLVGFLSGGIRAIVIAIVILVVGLVIPELQGQPVLRIRIVSTPTGVPYL